MRSSPREGQRKEQRPDTRTVVTGACLEGEVCSCEGSLPDWEQDKAWSALSLTLVQPGNHRAPPWPADQHLGLVISAIASSTSDNQMPLLTSEHLGTVRDKLCWLSSCRHRLMMDSAHSVPMV